MPHAVRSIEAPRAARPARMPRMPCAARPARTVLLQPSRHQTGLPHAARPAGALPGTGPVGRLDLQPSFRSRGPAAESRKNRKCSALCRLAGLPAPPTPPCLYAPPGPRARPIGLGPPRPLAGRLRKVVRNPQGVQLIPGPLQQEAPGRAEKTELGHRSRRGHNRRSLSHHAHYVGAAATASVHDRDNSTVTMLIRFRSRTRYGNHAAAGGVQACVRCIPSRPRTCVPLLVALTVQPTI